MLVFSDEQGTMVDLLKEYRKNLIGIGAELSPEIESGGMEFFTLDQATAITDYIQSTYVFFFTNTSFWCFIADYILGTLLCAIGKIV